MRRQGEAGASVRGGCLTWVRLVRGPRLREDWGCELCERDRRSGVAKRRHRCSPPRRAYLVPRARGSDSRSAPPVGDATYVRPAPARDQGWRYVTTGVGEGQNVLGTSASRGGTGTAGDGPRPADDSVSTGGAGVRWSLASPHGSDPFSGGPPSSAGGRRAARRRTPAPPRCRGEHDRHGVPGSPEPQVCPAPPEPRPVDCSRHGDADA